MSLNGSLNGGLNGISSYPPELRAACFRTSTVPTPRAIALLQSSWRPGMKSALSSKTYIAEMENRLARPAIESRVVVSDDVPALAGQREAYACVDFATGEEVGVYAGFLCTDYELSPRGFLDDLDLDRTLVQLSQGMDGGIPTILVHAVVEEVIQNRHGLFQKGDAEMLLSDQFLISEAPSDVFANPKFVVSCFQRVVRDLDDPELAATVVELFIRVGQFLLERYAVRISDGLQLSTFGQSVPACFANDARGESADKINCEIIVRAAKDHFLPYVCLTARRPIRAGETLILNYEWDEVAIAAEQDAAALMVRLWRSRVQGSNRVSNRAIFDLDRIDLASTDGSVNTECVCDFVCSECFDRLLLQDMTSQDVCCRRCKARLTDRLRAHHERDTNLLKMCADINRDPWRESASPAAMAPSDRRDGAVGPPTMAPSDRLDRELTRGRSVTGTIDRYRNWSLDCAQHCDTSLPAVVTFGALSHIQIRVFRA